MSNKEVVRLAKFGENSESKVKLSSLTELIEKGIFPIINLNLTETSLLFYVWLGAVGLNLKKEVCEIIRVHQDVVAEFEVLVYLNGQRDELLFIQEADTPTSSSQIPNLHIFWLLNFPLLTLMMFLLNVLTIKNRVYIIKQPFRSKQPSDFYVNQHFFY
jgi:hypothetical protein